MQDLFKFPQMDISLAVSFRCGFLLKKETHWFSVYMSIFSSFTIQQCLQSKFTGKLMLVATFFINFAAIFSSLINAQCYEFLVMCTDAALQPLHYGNQLLPSLWHRDLFPIMNSLDQFILLLVISSIFLNCKSRLTYLLDYLLFLSCLNRYGMSMR